ncbi:MAG: hypothetical protein EH225_01910 [Calditrichaeota bacterium]|nr:FecR domain-containing protein [Calditrichota bacterium]RQW07439.1 MAG: hypothetical protein EH225_01910 [Calditrichota bacterium]
MKVSTRIFAAFTFLFFMTLMVYAADPVAVVYKPKGTVEVMKSDDAKAQDARKGMVLYDGNRIKTGESSFCAVQFFDDKSLLRIKEKSACTIEGKKTEEVTDKNVIVEIGTFFASLFQPRGKFTITTPTSVASVKGTQWWTIQLLDGRTIYICMEGSIDCENNAGKFLLKAGQTAIFTSMNSSPEIRLTNPEEIPQEEEAGRMESLEIEFKDPEGQTRTLIIDYQEQ